ncbi:MAG: hypothetical protein WB611_10085 [Stellaceae bacterium]
MGWRVIIAPIRFVIDALRGHDCGVGSDEAREAMRDLVRLRMQAM